MKIEYTLPFRRERIFQIARTSEPALMREKPPRVSRLIALAHKLDELVHTGAVNDYTTLARLGHITPARVTQLMTLLHLSPQIQERVLFMSLGDARFVTEQVLRAIAREPSWDRQAALFEGIILGRTSRTDATIDFSSLSVMACGAAR